MEIRRNDEAGRYELWVGDDLVSISDFLDDGRTVTLPHTLTTPRFRGQGFAAQVTRAALDDARQAGRAVVPSCWFVAEYITEHPEYQDLVRVPLSRHDDGPSPQR